MKEKEEKQHGLDKQTHLQAAFEKTQEKRQVKRILKHPKPTIREWKTSADPWTLSWSTPTFPKSAERSCLPIQGITGKRKAKLGLFVPLVFSAETVLSKAVCPLSGTD